MREASRRSALIALLVAAAAFGCGDDGNPAAQGSAVGKQGTVVGGPCTTTSGCAASSQCETDGDFPGGTCVVACSSDAQCPDGTRCISSKGGVCLLTCTTEADCRSGYPCQTKSREGADGETKVCIK